MIIRIALRNLGRHWRRTMIAVSIIAFGLAGYLFFGGFNRAFVVDMVEQSIRNNLGHARLEAREFVRSGRVSDLIALDATATAVLDDSQVLAWTPRLVFPAMIASSHRSAGINLRAVDWGKEASVSRLDTLLIKGEMPTVGSRRILLGYELAKKLKLRPGKRVALYFTDHNGDSAGVSLRVGGIVRYNEPELDGSTVFMDIQKARSLIGVTAAVSEVALMLRGGLWSADDWVKSQAVTDTAPYTLQSWSQAAPFLSQMVGSISASMKIYLIIILAAVIIGILDTLLISVYERFFEFGVSRAIGFSRWQILSMIMFESVFVGILSVILGVAIGAGLIAWTHHTGIDLSFAAEGMRMFGLSPILRPVFSIEDTVTGVVSILAMIPLITLYPASKALRRTPLELLRERGI